MAAPARAGRVIAGILVVAVIAIGVILGLNPFGSNVPEGVDTDATEVRSVPEGVDTDATEVRSVTMSGDDYEVVDYNDVLYELVPENTEVFVLDGDVTRQFISRDRNTIWITEETAERIGVDTTAE